jgi:hypothetical protein
MIDEVTLNDKIVSTVKNCIPSNIKITNSLMEMLGLSRESVYRRIRKEIPFSIYELMKLSLKLGFSIDEIIEGNNPHFIPDLQSGLSAGSLNGFISLFQEYNNYINILAEAKNQETFIALNDFPPLFAIFSESLFKFNYYRDLINRDDTSKTHTASSFSDVKIPRRLQSLFEQIATNLHKVNNAILIFSPNIYLSVIKSIQYFYRRKLLTSDELLLLRGELYNMINLAEIVTKFGYYNKVTKVDIYLSALHINSNSLYIKYDEVCETHLWIYDNNPLIIRNKDVCDMQREWFLSMKKRSMLVSQSNEILQENFFNEQRKYIATFLTEDSISPYGY